MFSTDVYLLNNHFEGRMRSSTLAFCGQILVGLVATIIFVPEGHAGLVTFGFEGHITQVNIVTTDPFSGRITVGTTFQGTYSFDLNTPNLGTPTSATYESSSPNAGINVQIGGLTGSSATAGVPLNYRIRLDDVSQGTVQDIQTQDEAIGGSNAYLVQLFLSDPTASALSTVALSSTPPDLSSYATKNFFLGIGAVGGSTQAVFLGTIDSITSVPIESTSIPEPSTLILFCTGAFSSMVLLGRDRMWKKISGAFSHHF